ncbi:MAG: DUF2239 family protein [Reyranellaceae bacterium]
MSPLDSPLSRRCTAFVRRKVIASGPISDVALAVKRAGDGRDPVLVFDDATGRIVDLDLRGTDAEVLDRLATPAQVFIGRYRPPARERSEAGTDDGPSARGRGRPKLGVVAREVTLLPRHWEWLAAQRSGASATLRRLVEDARKAPDPGQQRRAAQEAAYQFMLAIAGDLPGYEEATRALFAGDHPALAARMAGWPEDIRAYALRLASAASPRPNSP